MTGGPTARALRRYVVTGGAAAVIDLCGFLVLIALGTNVLPAAILSFLAANVANFRLSARYAFGHAPNVRRYPRFLGASLLGLGVNVAGTAAAAALGAPALLAKTFGIGVAFAVNFALNRLFVFPAAGAGPAPD